MTQVFDDDLIGGRYRLVRKVGQGGMGTVWQARDETLDRIVAIKQLTSPSDTPTEVRAQQVQRVRREARMAARLDHPGIVRVHDVIDWEGAPAIVMEYVQGRSLAERLRESAALTVEGTARLGSALLDALRHAHTAGVVHRDLKPDNILLAGTRTVITDFGIARPLVGATTLTPHGSIIGTPAFMAPEQIEGKEVTAASDLWALGVTLYTAVEGTRPFEAETLTELCLAILTRPMLVPRKAGPLTPLLEALLTKDPAARATAQDAAEHLAGIGRIAVTPTALEPEPSAVTEVLTETQPLAGAPGLEHGEASVGQQTGPAAVTGHPDTGISVGPEPAVPEAAGTNRQLDNPVPGPHEATKRTVRTANVTHKPSADHRTRPRTGPGDRKHPVRRPRRRLVVVTLACAVSAAAVIIPLLLPGTPSKPHTNAGSLSASRFTTLTGTAGSASSVAFAPKSTTLAACDAYGHVYLWDTTTGKRTATFTNPITGTGVPSVAFAPSGTTLAYAYAGSGKTYLWDTTTRKRTATLTNPNISGGAGNSVAFAADGTTLAVADGNNTYLWDTTTGKLTATLTDPNSNGIISTHPVAFATSGTTLAAGGLNGHVYLWDTSTGKLTATFTGGSDVTSLAFAPNGTTLAAGGGGDSTYLWDTTTGKLTATLTDPSGSFASSMAFAPNGTTLATGEDNGHVYLWDTTSGKLTTTLTGGSDMASVAFTQNGTTLAAGDRNGNTYLWKIAGAGP